MSNSEAPRRDPGKVRNPLKAFALRSLAIIAAVLIAWFAGRWTASSAAKGRAAALREEIAAVRADNDLLEFTTDLLRAHASLQDAATDLERRNYGSASEDLRQADRQLEEHAEAGPEAAELARIQKSLRAVDLTVQSDVGAQRQRILRLADDLRRLIPPPLPVRAETAP